MHDEWKIFDPFCPTLGPYSCIYMWIYVHTRCFVCFESLIDKKQKNNPMFVGPKVTFKNSETIYWERSKVIARLRFAHSRGKKNHIRLVGVGVLDCILFIKIEWNKLHKRIHFCLHSFIHTGGGSLLAETGKSLRALSSSLLRFLFQ